MHGSTQRLIISLTAVLLLLASGPAAAQSDAPRVYTMFFQIDSPDTPAWLELHEQYEVPLLDSLVAEGALLSYDLWMHNTGGRYNLRYNFLTPSWNAIGDFQDAYYERLASGVWPQFLSMVREHTDEIWRVGDSYGPEGGKPASPFVYESSYHVDYGRQAEWAADFDRYGKPALERAVEEGLIEGWAEMHHDTGGPWNVKLVYWLESWDAMDEALIRLAEIRTELGEGMESGRTIRRHADEIWLTTMGSR